MYKHILIFAFTNPTLGIVRFVPSLNVDLPFILSDEFRLKLIDSLKETGVLDKTINSLNEEGFTKHTLVWSIELIKGHEKEENKEE